MRISRRLSLLTVAFLVLAGAGLGCSGKSISDTDPTELFKDAEEDVSNDRYTLAIEKFRSVKNNYPYSKLATEAQLRLSDVYFLQESFAEAALSYQGFVDLHPKHEKVSYALFRVGLAYLKDAPDLIARDQTSSQKAVDAFATYIKKYPNSPESEEAKVGMTEATRRLSEKDLYIAEFYFKRDFWSSAKTRYEKIIATYPNSAAATKARTRLPMVMSKLGNN